MHQLAQVASVQPILLQIQETLRQRGDAHASVVVPGQSEPLLFDVMTGVRFIDHGQGQPGMRCQACPSGHGLRYEFQIETVTGELFGPVGSTCVFTRVLGEGKAKSIGKTLEAGVRAYQEHLHCEEQEALLKEAGNWRAYLRRLGFEWLLLALVEGGGGRLSAELRAALTETQEKNRVLSLKLLGTLNRLTAERSRTTVKSAMIFRRLPSMRAPGRFSPLARIDGPVVRSGSGAALRPRPEAGGAMSLDQWSKHVLSRRLEPAIQNWDAVASLLEMNEEEKKDIKWALDHRRPLKLEVLERLRPAMRSAGVPAWRPEPVRKLPKQRPEEAYQSLIDQRQQQAQLAVQISHTSVNEGGFGMINLQDDPLYIPLQEDWNLIAPLVAMDRQSAITHSLLTGFTHEDDHQLLLDAAAVVTTPQLRPEYRAADYFLQYLVFKLGKAGIRWDSELQSMGVEIFEQGRPLALLTPFLKQYVRGEAVDEEELLRNTHQAIELFRRVRRDQLRQNEQVQLRLRKKQVDVIRTPEMQILWDAWGRGLAEAFQEPERKVLGNALRRANANDLQLKRLTEAHQHRTRKIKARQVRTGAVAARQDEPIGSVDRIYEKRTPIAFAVALCTELEQTGQGHLRRKLVGGSLAWPASAMPTEFDEFVSTGRVTANILRAAAKTLG